jgi:hypothetical protein
MIIAVHLEEGAPRAELAARPSRATCSTHNSAGSGQ